MKKDGCLVEIAVWLATAIIGTFLYGWALMNLWRWFGIPVFHTAPLTIAQALGLSLLLGMFIPKPEPTQRPKQDQASRYVGYIASAAAPLMALLLGFILHPFI